MTKYVLTYHGGSGEMPTDPAVLEEMMAAWGAWYGSMGDALVDGGNPFSVHTAVGPDGSVIEAPAALTGYTVVQTDSMDAAVEIAKGCPVSANGASVQISECLDM